MDYDDKTLALAKFLDVNPKLIENNYGEYFTVNERKVKRGQSPEEIKKTAQDFRSLMTDSLIKRILKASSGHLSKKSVDKLYDDIKAHLETMKDNEVYQRLDKDNLYIANVAYHLVCESYEKPSAYVEQLRNAFRLNKEVKDIRTDDTKNDGEYLVLTDSEADDFEEDGLRSLFEDMTHGVEGIAANYLDEDGFVEDHRGNRGENISGYDGAENEVEFEGTTYYIYRTN